MNEVTIERTVYAFVVMFTSMFMFLLFAVIFLRGETGVCYITTDASADFPVYNVYKEINWMDDEKIGSSLDLDEAVVKMNKMCPKDGI